MSLITINRQLGLPVRLWMTPFATFDVNVTTPKSVGKGRQR